MLIPSVHRYVSAYVCLCIFVAVCVCVCLCTCLSISVCVCISFSASFCVCLYLYIFICLYKCLFMSVSLFFLLCLSFCTSACLSFHLSVSAHLCVCLSVRPSFSMSVSIPTYTLAPSCPPVRMSMHLGGTDSCFHLVLMMQPYLLMHSVFPASFEQLLLLLRGLLLPGLPHSDEAAAAKSRIWL